MDFPWSFFVLLLYYRPVISNDSERSIHMLSIVRMNGCIDFSR